MVNSLSSLLTSMVVVRVSLLPTLTNIPSRTSDLARNIAVFFIFLLALSLTPHQPMSSSSAVKSVALRTLRHLEPPNKGDKFNPRTPTYAQHKPKFVQPKDRIAYWNIVPGDHVKLRSGRAHQIGDEKVPSEGIVDKIDRSKNWVWLRDVDDEHNKRAPKAIKHAIPRLVDPLDPSKGFSPNVHEISRPVHYSNIMLKIPGREEYAMRLSNSAPKYNPARGTFVWRRYATIRLPLDKARELGKLTEKVQVPWPKSTPFRRVMSSEMTDRRGVEAETWAPWRPEDPVLLAPPKGITSALSEQRAAVLAEERKQLDARKAAARPKPLRPKDAMGIYPGFDIKIRGKPPPIAQPPTPAETIRERQELAAQWAQSEPLQQHRQEGGLAFLYRDYLDLAPRHGPASGGDWSDLPASVDKGGLDAPRDEHTGRLTQKLGRLDLDRMPIELLMTKDLANYHGLKWRMRRWQQMQADKKVLAAENEKKSAELLKELKVLKL